MTEIINIFITKYKLYIKYIIAGGTAAATNLAILIFMTDVLNIYYLISTTVAFIIAYFVSFYLQKFWTFRDNSRDQIVKQMSVYFMVGVVNLGINDGGMYVLVDKVKLHHIPSQIIMGALIAIGSFMIYRFIIFKKTAISNIK